MSNFEGEALKAKRANVATRISRRMRISHRVNQVITAGAIIYCSFLAADKMELTPKEAPNFWDKFPLALQVGTPIGSVGAAVLERLHARKQCQRTVVLFGRDNSCYVLNHGDGLWHKTYSSDPVEMIESLSSFATPTLGGTSGIISGAALKAILEANPNENVLVEGAMATAGVLTVGVTAAVSSRDRQNTDRLTRQFINDLNGVREPLTII